ncbi:MAG: ATP-binding protein [Hyphomonadaceae bacterium]|nr:ATP-binding protein [Hyphomonadaceae bacterium]
MRLRDYTPQGYNARHIMILIVPMMIFVVSMTLYFFTTHVQQVNSRLSRAVADELAFVNSERLTNPQIWVELTDGFRRSGLMDVTFTPGVTTLIRPDGEACCDELGEELRLRFRDQTWAYRYRPDDLLTVRILMDDGLLEAKMDRKRVIIINAHIFIVWTVAFSVFLLITSYLFLRNQVRSILQLSWAADVFGRGEDMPNFKPSGALEVRKAARSLLRMRNRIRRYADQRTAMLAGVSHDLRTPLARLKLELALAPKEYDTTEARRDIDEMERMLDGYLAFARGEDSEQPVPADVTAIAREASAVAATRTDLEFVSVAPVQMRIRPLALKRAISNLANNAADHGKKVRVTVSTPPGEAVITIEDDGPGIPPENYEDAFRPFSRLDPSRNQNVSGVGLGLTIARDTARAHGGDVTLGKSELGGLRAVIRLPLDAERPKGLRDEDD